MKDFYGIVKTRRKELGMTQRDLAKASGVSKTHICALENSSNPNWNTIVKILQVLGFKVVIEKIQEG